MEKSVWAESKQGNNLLRQHTVWQNQTCANLTAIQRPETSHLVTGMNESFSSGDFSRGRSPISEASVSIESQSKPGSKMVDPDLCKEFRRRISAAIYGWDCPLVTFIYPGFDRGSSGLCVFEHFPHGLARPGICAEWKVYVRLRLCVCVCACG